MLMEPIREKRRTKLKGMGTWGKTPKKESVLTKIAQAMKWRPQMHVAKAKLYLWD